MRRAVIFAHFDRDGLIDPHVRYYLAALRKHAVFVVFVSTSASEDELGAVRGKLVDVAFTRENIGYDFLSWKCGYSALEEPLDFDEILFVNDSVYGPMHDLSSVFASAGLDRYKFWGLAKSHEIEPHIQSYFFCFSRALVENGVIDGFWENVDVIENKQDLIRSYEVGMTRYIRRFVSEDEVGCLFDQKELTWPKRLRAGLVNGRWRKKNRVQAIKSALKGRIRNPCHQYWRSLLEAGVPFLKVELMRDNPEELELDRVRRYLARSSSYPLELMEQHLRRISSSSSSVSRG